MKKHFLFSAFLLLTFGAKAQFPIFKGTKMAELAFRAHKSAYIIF
jgi:hypothetical protein